MKIENDKIKNWYMLNHAYDDIAWEINSKTTFKTLWEGLKAGRDVYRMLGVCDSWVREIVFHELADRLDVKYETVYNTWLGK